MGFGCAIGATVAAVQARAQTGASGGTITAGAMVSPADSCNALLSMVEGQMMGAVKAMPAEKYGFAPSAAIFVPTQKTDYTGVRTFGALVVHVTQANYGLAAKIGDMKPDVDVKGLAALKDKDKMVAALAASFAFVHKAIGTMTSENAFQSVGGPMTRATQAGFVAAHTSDEYGQMVEYLRMNGIVPPASQK